jgi:regulator of replication initiation timing
MDISGEFFKNTNKIYRYFEVLIKENKNLKEENEKLKEKIKFLEKQDWKDFSNLITNL